MITCKIHGLLAETDVIKAGVGKSGKQRLRCKLCFKKTRDINYEKNKEKILLACEKWRIDNPEKVREWKRDSYHKNKHKYKEREKKSRLANKEKHRDRCKRNKEKLVQELYDSYVIDILRRGTNLAPSDIPQQLIEFKKTLIILGRKVRTLNATSKKEKET